MSAALVGELFGRVDYVPLHGLIDVTAAVTPSEPVMASRASTIGPVPQPEGVLR